MTPLASGTHDPDNPITGILSGDDDIRSRFR